MNRRPIVLSVLLIVSASCDAHVVRFDPVTAPKVDGDGLRFALENFREDLSSVRTSFWVTNQTAAPLVSEWREVLTKNKMLTLRSS
jgi:hypothetical protein